MTALLLLGVFGSGAAGGGLGCHLWHRARTVAADIDHYDGAWDPTDREALKQEVAVAVVDRSRWHRTARRLEHEKRNLAELLASRHRRPIPLPARHPIPTYGNRSTP